MVAQLQAKRPCLMASHLAQRTIQLLLPHALDLGSAELGVVTPCLHPLAPQILLGMGVPLSLRLINRSLLMRHRGPLVGDLLLQAFVPTRTHLLMDTLHLVFLESIEGRASALSLGLLPLQQARPARDFYTTGFRTQASHQSIPYIKMPRQVIEDQD